MFSIEIRFATNCLLSWFHNKYRNEEVDKKLKMQYQKENPID